jgi:hypothetical protein
VWKREGAVAALALMAACVAAAQTAKPEAAADAAAMERARRQAAGPMRIILEASKARRKTAETEAAPASGPAAANTRGIPPRAAVAAAAPDAALPASPAQAASAPAAATAVASAPAVNADTGIVTQITLNSAALESRAPVTIVPAMVPAAGVAPVVSPTLPVAPNLQLPALAVATPAVAVDSRPRLSRMVEPDVPQRVLQDIAVNTAVLVDLNLRADGTVAAVNVLPPAPRQLSRFIAAALEQWRFEPLPAARVHRIELVFNAER